MRAAIALFNHHANNTRKTMPHSTFPGFPKALTQFLANLSANNNREWFEDHRADYQAHVVEPALDFITAMMPIVENGTPPLRAEAKLNGSLRRIHRDVRFSKDKTPYNPRLHIIFWAGNHPSRSPASHVVLGPQFFGFGAGQWALDKNQLDSFRTNLMRTDKLKPLLKAINTASKDGQNLMEPALKRLPKGFEGEGELGQLLRQKAIVVRNNDEAYAPDIFNNNCLSYIEKRIQASAPINNWLLQNL